MSVRLILGDCLQVLPTLEAGSVQCCVTSPPYWGLRRYLPEGHPDAHQELGIESTPAEYVAQMVAVFREVRRVLRDDGTLFLNLGDSYAGGGTVGRNDAGRDIGGGGNKLGSGNPGPQGTRPSVDSLKPKDLCGIPWRVAFALQADGWYLRQDIIWAKPNPMPESVRDRCTKAHEYIFLLTKSERYFWDAEAIAEPSEYPEDNRKARQSTSDYENMLGDNGQLRAVINPNGAKTYATRNARSVWTITPKPCPEAHFATFPPELPERCIRAGSRVGDCVLEPFMGSGTTGMVAVKHGRNFIGCELNPAYMEIAERRIAEASNTLWTPPKPKQPDPELYPS